MIQLNCDFFNPVNLGSTTEDFEFSSSTCIESDSTSTQKYINGFSYGEVILIVLAIAFFMIWAYTKIRKINV